MKKIYFYVLSMVMLFNTTGRAAQKTLQECNQIVEEIKRGVIKAGDVDDSTIACINVVLEDEQEKFAKELSLFRSLAQKIYHSSTWTAQTLESANAAVTSRVELWLKLAPYLGLPGVALLLGDEPKISPEVASTMLKYSIIAFLVSSACYVNHRAATLFWDSVLPRMSFLHQTNPRIQELEKILLWALGVQKTLHNKSYFEEKIKNLTEFAEKNVFDSEWAPVLTAQ